MACYNMKEISKMDMPVQLHYDYYFCFEPLEKSKGVSKISYIREWTDWLTINPGRQLKQNRRATKWNWNETTKLKYSETQKSTLSVIPKRVKIFRPSSAKNCLADSSMGPSDSTAIGWEIYYVPRFAYLVILRSAADSASDPVLLATASRSTSQLDKQPWHPMSEVCFQLMK